MSQLKYFKGLDHLGLCGKSTRPRCDNEDKSETWRTCWTIDSKSLKTSIKDAKQCDVWSWPINTIVVLEGIHVA